MKKTLVNSLRVIGIVITFIFCFNFCQAQISVTPNLTATDMLDYITGTNVTVSNAVLTCPAGASGTFIVTGTSPLGLDSGIILTSGRLLLDTNILGWDYGVVGNASELSVGNNGAPGDSDLTASIGSPTFDACRLDFDFVSTFDTVLFYYNFASDNSKK
jgi:hypothetical protein